MKKVLIIHNKILHYRKALYNTMSNNYNVTVIHSGNKIVDDYDKFNEIITPLNKIGPFYWQNDIIKIVNSGDYDYVVAMFDIRWLSSLLAMSLKKRNVKFIWWGVYLTSNAIANFIRLRISKLNNPIVFYSKDAKDSFVKSGIDETKLFVANNTFHVDYNINLLSKDPTYILFVGSFDTRKRNDILIKMFNRISDKIPSEIKLVLIGSGDEEQTLKLLVSDSNLSKRILFPGRINNTADLESYYSNAIISVSYGQAGLSVLQSFGYGVPFMTIKNAISGGEISNIINNYNGYRCATENDFENCLVKVCNDKDLINNLRKNSFDYYNKECSIDNMVEGFVQAFNKN